MKSEKILFANNLRGLAALMVVISHYLINFWTMREAVSELTMSPVLDAGKYPDPWFTSVFDFGHSFEWGSIGVGVFFIISGFVIPFSIKKHSGIEFIYGRIMRIMPVYVFGFTLTLLCIYMTSLYFSKPFTIRFNEIAIHYFPGLRDVLNSKGIDGIIWTLEIEVKFYMLCILLRSLIKCNSILVLLSPVFSCLLSVIMSHMSSLGALPSFLLSSQLYLPYFSIMFIGVAFHYNNIGKISMQFTVALIAVYIYLFYLTISLGDYKSLSWTAHNYVYSAIIFSSCMWLNLLNTKNRFFGFMSDISYPFYVIHGVFGYCLIRILCDNGVYPIISVMCTFIFVVILSSLIHESIEKRFMVGGGFTITRKKRGVVS